MITLLTGTILFVENFEFFLTLMKKRKKKAKEFNLESATRLITLGVERI